MNTFQIQVETEAETPRTLARILIAEDNEMVRRWVAKGLRKRGYEVVEAQDGQEAQEIFDSVPQAFDLLVTDIMMPRMNGCELSKRLLVRNPNLKIIYMSAYDNGMLSKNDIHRRVDLAFLPKPFSAETLMSTIATELAKPDQAS